ncbi:hypothetical protein NECAME_11913 [Necator americanus]|uniref:Uncharacterized protein n=1 Tax=Necator americanus TaxID=51031 RepID=W2T278_NECAM|nr:hypothetical protein NECAME_11913 [Necator americanus]ETN76110.1 hypothetical protein NECAME_11913 [Necator americanus]
MKIFGRTPSSTYKNPSQPMTKDRLRTPLKGRRVFSNLSSAENMCHILQEFFKEGGATYDGGGAAYDGGGGGGATG